MKKMRYGAKGQAALEFIMTYGWAILVVLVAIGALAYFGVLSPDKLLPNKCLLQSGLACTDHKVSATAGVGGVGRVTVRLTNSLGYDISAVDVTTASCQTNVVGDPTTLTNGAAGTFNVDCPAALTSTKFNEVLNVTYTITDSGIAHSNKGQLTTALQ